MKLVCKKPGIIGRHIHGSYFLIDITDNYQNDICAIHELNETGAFLWEQVDGEAEIVELVKRLQDAILEPVDYDVLLVDVNEFVHSLVMDGLAEIEEHG